MSGVRARWRGALATWALTAALAAGPALSLAALLHRFFGARAAGEAMASQLAPLPAVDFILNQQAELMALGPGLLAALGLWLLATPLIQGLALNAARRDLLAAAGRAYGRLLRLLPLTTLIIVAVMAPVALGLGWALGRGLEGETSEVKVLAFRVAGAASAGAVLALLTGVAGLARAAAVARDEPRAARALGQGVMAALARPGRLWALTGLYAVAAIALTVGASLLDAALPRGGVGLLIAGVALQQGTALLRAVLRVSLAGAYLQWMTVEPASVVSRGDGA
ncbi:MAG: hypothetical protein H6730_04985 [Deltaproteobacteria bacterium]|nr:hypothetical protein [Deltaproteobacteria bacterium]